MKKSIPMGEALDVAENKQGLTELKHTSFKQVEEKRTANIQAMITPTEKELIFDTIGRRSVSDITRELYLYMFGLPIGKPENRKLILELIKKNNA